MGTSDILLGATLRRTSILSGGGGITILFMLQWASLPRVRLYLPYSSDKELVGDVGTLDKYCYYYYCYYYYYYYYYYVTSPVELSGKICAWSQASPCHSVAHKSLGTRLISEQSS